LNINYTRVANHNHFQNQGLQTTFPYPKLFGMAQRKVAFM